MVEPVQIEQRTDLAKARSVEIGATLGGVSISSLADLEMISLRLARGMVAVPVHCRDQPGVCFALAMQALEWGMPIMSVINKSYVPRNGDRIGYESQLLHAVVEKNAPLKKRLRATFEGEGAERRCIVSGTFKGEDAEHRYESQPLSKLHPGHITKDGNRYVKGSQVWDDNPDVALFYSATRQWARMWCPDVLLGAYTPEELERAEPMDVTPTKVEALAQRLREKTQAHASDRGFDADYVAKEASARSTIIEGDVNSGDAKREVSDENDAGGRDATGVEGGQDAVGDRGDEGLHEGGSAGAVGSDQEVVNGTAGPSATEEGQGEIFPPDRKPKPQPKGKGKR